MIMGKWVGGGVEAVVMNYYKNIDRNLIQFDFIFDNDSKNVPTDDIERMGGKIYFVPRYNEVINYHFSLKKIFETENYKIVHSHINTLSIFSLFAAKRAGIPVRIAHSHSTTNTKEKGKNMLKQVLRPFSKLFATDYMTCSELAGRWLFGNAQYDRGNVYLLNNAIDSKKFTFNPEIRAEVRKSLNLRDETFVIGHIGRFVTQKNHAFLIDIFYEIHQKNPDSVLLLAGEGPLMQKIKDKVKEYGVEDSVKFLGQRADVSRLYQAFDVFVLPSLYEGLPVVGVEAQAAGLQCFFSDDMTSETEILSSTRFLSLKLSSQDWSDIIVFEHSSFDRKNTSEDIRSNGFEIKTEATKLEKKYFELWKRV